jgi:hypothetical protein
MPTTDGREIVLSLYTQPGWDVCPLLERLKLCAPGAIVCKIYSPDKDSKSKTVQCRRFNKKCSRYGVYIFALSIPRSRINVA